MERVLITGLGIVSSAGSGPEAFWQGLRRESPQPIVFPDPNAHMPWPLLYAVPEADIPADTDGLDGIPLGRTSRMAVEAARQAVDDSGLEGIAPSRLGVVIGTGMGDSGLHEQWRVDGVPADQGWAPAFAVAAAVGERLGGFGVNCSVSNACAASGYALGVAADVIRCGEADIVLAGGAEGYSRVAMACFNRLGAIDSLRCRPFDRHRRGTVFGEGAGILVLESESHARKRHAPHVYARLAGSGWSCDGYHPTAPDPTGRQIVLGMVRALEEAGIGAESVGCVVPHGTGTELNDIVESQSLNVVFGARCVDIPLYSLKAIVGHTGGAAGALAALTAALILDRGTVPPNAPLDEQDPECKVWLPQVVEVPAAGAVMVNAYAFGGNNVSLVLEQATR